MIVYEVTASVDEEICEAYERYMLDKHIADVLQTGAFTSASFEKGEPGVYRARYLSPSRESLNSYFANSAPTMRRDFANHFPHGVDLARAEWTVLGQLA
jgi:hypothetical protein